MITQNKIDKTGTLYVVATPIGNLADLSGRAIQILSEVDLIACEDTRHSHILLDHFNIKKPLVALHEHNEAHQVKSLLAKLQKGAHIALISDAGTPLISDPGYRLVKAAGEADVPVHPLPGPCAAIAALSISGLPTDKFIFEGYLPAKATQRRERLEALQSARPTLIFYEAPHRVIASLEDCAALLGNERRGVIARELTKTFETIYRGTLSELQAVFVTHPEQMKGEFVILIAGCEQEALETVHVGVTQILEILLKELPLKQAVLLAAEITGAKKNTLYEEAIKRLK